MISQHHCQMRLLAMQWLKPTTSARYKGAYFAFAAFWADGEGQYDLRLDKGQLEKYINFFMLIATSSL